MITCIKRKDIHVKNMDIFYRNIEGGREKERERDYQEWIRGLRYKKMKAEYMNMNIA